MTSAPNKNFLITSFQTMPIVVSLSIGYLPPIQTYIITVILFVPKSKHGYSMQNSIGFISNGVFVMPKLPFF